MDAPDLFLLAGCALANVAGWVWLRGGAWWRRGLLPPVLLAGWSIAPAWLDASFANAQHPGHAVAVAAGCFVVMGFPAWVVHRLR